jgi:hypothetical protein
MSDIQSEIIGQNVVKEVTKYLIHVPVYVSESLSYLFIFMFTKNKVIKISSL